jgi:hypothetical protein
MQDQSSLHVVVSLLVVTEKSEPRVDVSFLVDGSSGYPDVEQVRRVLFPVEVERSRVIVSSDDEIDVQRPDDGDVPEEQVPEADGPDDAEEDRSEGTLGSPRLEDLSVDVAAGPETLISPDHDLGTRSTFEFESATHEVKTEEPSERNNDSELEIDEELLPLFRSFNSQGGIDFVASQTLDGTFRQNWLIFVCDDRLLCRALRVYV